MHGTSAGERQLVGPRLLGTKMKWKQEDTIVSAVFVDIYGGIEIAKVVSSFW
jgi:hypothetical protein